MKLVKVWLGIDVNASYTQTQSSVPHRYKLQAQHHAEGSAIQEQHTRAWHKTQGIDMFWL